MALYNSTYFTYNSPVGRITIAADGVSITTIAFGEVELEGTKKASELTNRAANQLQEYFAGKRSEFQLPLNPAGTDFQKQVWDALQTIPYGSTCSYSDIAAIIGNPKACRAVGGANNKNPIPIIIPCHRVIGVNGKPVGYAGTLKTKMFLLDLERR